MKRARILIADDHEVSRQGIRRLLEARRDWEVCGEAADGRAAVQLARDQKPDLAILDISMPELNGLDAARQILKELPRTEILILTMHEMDRLARDVLAAGIRGFMLKSDAGQELLRAIDALLNHRPYFTAKVSKMVLDGYLNPKDSTATSAAEEVRLTPREREILQLVAEGKSSKEIADLLSISLRTVETHRTNIMRRAGLRSAAEMVRYAIRNQIVEP